jgi:pimeloyl-ACP methyl ester carboxylesterase
MNEHVIGENRIFVVDNNIENQSFKHPLVLVHGSWGGSWMWGMYNKYFTKKGFRTYSLDLRGHGKSEGELAGVTMENYVSDVREIVENLEIENPVVIGHSMGGLVAVMYASKYVVSATISINGSPSAEVQESKKEIFPEIYSPVDVGMPTDPMKAMEIFPDIDQAMLMKMKDMLGMESGVARSQRKKGISVSKDDLTSPLLFIGTEKADSVPFGVGIEKSRSMAEFYDGDFIEIEGATHPGILMGEMWQRGAEIIEDWLKDLN